MCLLPCDHDQVLFTIRLHAKLIIFILAHHVRCQIHASDDCWHGMLAYLDASRWKLNLDADSASCRDVMLCLTAG